MCMYLMLLIMPLLSTWHNCLREVIGREERQDEMPTRDLGAKFSEHYATRAITEASNSHFPPGNGQFIMQFRGSTSGSGRCLTAA